jgi:hypothetical protein
VPLAGGARACAAYRLQTRRICYATAVAQALIEGRDVERAESRPFG